MTNLWLCLLGHEGEHLKCTGYIHADQPPSSAVGPGFLTAAQTFPRVTLCSACTCQQDPIFGPDHLAEAAVWTLGRFKYSQEFLQWALQPPGYQTDWVVGVRVAGSRKLVAFITAVPAHLRASGTMLSLVEINFLCVHKKLRSKRLAPVLIKVPLCMCGEVFMKSFVLSYRDIRPPHEDHWERLDTLVKGK